MGKLNLKKMNYQANKNRNREMKKRMTFEDYLTGMHIEITIQPRQNYLFYCDDGLKHNFVNMRGHGNKYDKICTKCSFVISEWVPPSYGGHQNHKGCQFKVR